MRRGTRPGRQVEQGSRRISCLPLRRFDKISSGLFLSSPRAITALSTQRTDNRPYNVLISGRGRYNMRRVPQAAGDREGRRRRRRWRRQLTSQTTTVGHHGRVAVLQPQKPRLRARLSPANRRSRQALAVPPLDGRGMCTPPTVSRELFQVPALHLVPG